MSRKTIIRYPEIAGAVLAGGQGTRLGCPKFSLRLGRELVIDRVLAVLKDFFDEILVVAGDRRHIADGNGVSVVEDLVPGCGPLGGIYTGLMLSSKKLVFFAACDMPFLHPGLIKRVLSVAEDGQFECVIPYSDRGIEPLHGVYAKSVLNRLEKVLGGTDLSIRKILAQARCHYVEAKTEELESFFNLNTPRDMALINENKRG